MQAYWITFFAYISLFCRPLSCKEKYLLEEILDESITQAHIFDSQQPFSRRDLGQATVWNIHEESFAFHLLQKEDCQEVWVCSTAAGVKDIKTIDPKAQKASTWCKDGYVRFRPMESTVTIGLKYGDQTKKGDTSVFPWSRVIFEFDGKTKNYKLKVVSGERDIYGNVSKTEQKQISLNGLPLIITSSPYCRPIVQAAFSGRPVSSVTISEPGIQLAYPIQRDDKEENKKKFNGLLVPTVVTNYSVSSEVRCPPMWLSEFEKTKPNWPVETESMRQRAVHLLYEVHRRQQKKGQPNCDESPTWRSSIKLVIDKPETCNWIRLCFLETSGLCLDPTKSVELLLAYKLFVGVDSDLARSMEVPYNELQIIRFEMNRVGELATPSYRFTMSYSFASDEGGVQHHMFGNHMKEWLTATSFNVSLSRDRNCMARLAMDHLLESDNQMGKQCLSLRQCNVIRPEKYESFPGDQLIDLRELGPAQ